MNQAQSYANSNPNPYFNQVGNRPVGLNNSNTSNPINPPISPEEYARRQQYYRQQNQHFPPQSNQAQPLFHNPAFANYNNLNNSNQQNANHNPYNPHNQQNNPAFYNPNLANSQNSPINSSYNYNNQHSSQPQINRLAQTGNVTTAYQPPLGNPYQDLEKTVEEDEVLLEEENESYHNKNLFIGLFGLSLYFAGAILITFFTNINGNTEVTIEMAEMSWELFFSDFSTFVTNSLTNIFGYFIQYGRLFGFFEDQGSLNVEPKPRYLMPLDIILKASTIAYFHFVWMKADTKKALIKGILNSKYPYLQGFKKQKLAKVSKVQDDTPDLDSIPSSINSQDFQKELLNGNTNADLDLNTFESSAEEEGLEDDNGIPFSGVQKPIEEFYHNNEAKIYSIIRRKLLPGSNLIICLYFSTRSVLVLQDPLGIVLYILGIMSMFWCMQSFLLVLDHEQYPPEEEVI